LEYEIQINKIKNHMWRKKRERCFRCCK